MYREILKAQIDALQESIKAKKDVIISTREVIKAKEKELAEMENKKSAAADWAKRRNDEGGKGWDMGDTIDAHEAGQAQATAATHEIYKLLINSCREVIKILIAMSWTDTANILVTALKNLNQPAREEDPEIIGEAREWNTGPGKIHNVRLYLGGPGKFDASKKYKLTPID